MSKAQEISEKLQGQTLDTVRKAQDVIVETVTAWSTTIHQIPGYDKVADALAPTADIIDSNFDFAEELLASQRAFADRMVSVVSPKPAADRKQLSAPKKAAPKATTAPAKKAAPRKTATATTTAAKKTAATKA